LTKAQRETIARAATPKWTEFIPHAPTPKQRAFLLLNCREAFFGGSAGGGKSDALLMAALQYVDVPGYAAILFRRTYTDLALPEALMSRAQEWLAGTAAQWSAQDKTWRFPSGATLTFGYLEAERDKFRYQSAAFQYIGFDELTQFTEDQYRYLFSRLRRLEGMQVPVRMRAASNPGGLGHEWVRQRFIDQDPRETERIYIPAQLADNPHLDREEYERALLELDPVTRAQLLNGDWDARPKGNKFDRSWFELIELDAVPDGLRRVRFWDLAATEPKAGRDPDYTAGALLGMADDGTVYVIDVRRNRLDPGGVEALIERTAREDGVHVAIRIEEEAGASGKMVTQAFARRLAGFDFAGVRSTGSKEVLANPLSAAAHNGLVRVVRAPWNLAFFDELECFPNAGVHDDQVDAASGAYNELAATTAFFAEVL